MPTVLVIAYYFPPLGGAGVQRTLKFVKYLPDYGWLPHVLTVQDNASLQDSSLTAEIPAEIPITRTPILRLPPRLPWRLRNFISRWFLIVDEQLGWLPYAVSAGQRIIAESGNIQVIYSSSSPYTAHLIARHLHRRKQLPWVADFRDPWIENPYIKFPTSFHRRMNEHLEQSIYTEANRVILNTDVSRRRYIQKYSDLPATKFIAIPNGYDQADSPLIRHEAQEDSIFTITHLGSLYQKTRSSEYFLRALHEAFQAGKLLPDKVRVRFIGTIDKETKNFVRQLKLSSCVELLGYLPHRQALNYLFDANLLLLIPSYGKGGDLFVPAKIFEYLATTIPILCLAEPGACADLILQARAGWVVSPTAISEIAVQLVRIYQQWEAGNLIINPDRDMIASFERRKLTGQLANLLTEICK
jgi:glycosyltransferase involved in cell wall biosynthesis